MNDTSMPVSQKVLLALILLAGVFTRSYHLGDKILWIDEAINWKVSQMETVSDVREYYHFEQHTAFPNLIDRLWVRLAGDTEVALHLESLLWSLLAMGVFTAAVFIGLPWRAALPVVAVYALNPFLPEFAQMFRHQALSMFAATVWLLGLLGYRRRGEPVYLAIYAAGMVLAVFAHLYAIYTIACLGLFVLLTRRAWGRRFWPILLCHGVPALAILPKILLMKQMGVMGLAQDIPLSAAIAHLAKFPVGGIVEIIYQFCAGRYVGMRIIPTPVLFGILAVFGAAGIAAILNKEHRFVTALSVTVLGGTLLIGWLMMIFRSILFFSRYYVPLFSLFSILVGLGAHALIVKKPRIGPVLLAMYLIFSLGFLSVYWTRLNRPHNTKTVLAYLDKNSRPGDFANMSPPYPWLFEYYWKGDIPVHDFSDDFDIHTRLHNNLFMLTSKDRQLTPDRMMQWHEQLATRYKRVWILWPLGSINTEDRQEVARKWMEKHYEKLDSVPYRMFPYSHEQMGLLELYRIKTVEKSSYAH